MVIIILKHIAFCLYFLVSVLSLHSYIDSAWEIFFKNSHYSLIDIFLLHHHLCFCSWGYFECIDLFLTMPFLHFCHPMNVIHFSRQIFLLIYLLNLHSVKRLIFWIILTLVNLIGCPFVISAMNIFLNLTCKSIISVRTFTKRNLLFLILTQFFHERSS